MATSTPNTGGGPQGPGAIAEQTLLDSFKVPLERFVRARVRADEADDVVQEVWVKILTGLPKVDDHDRLPGWVRTVARHTLADHYRRNRRPGAAPQEVPPLVGDDPRDDASLNELVLGWLRPFAERLPEQYRDAVVWADFDHVPQKEIAARLGLSLSGAKSRVQRGRVALRDSLLACCDFRTDGAGNVTHIEPKGGGFDGTGDAGHGGCGATRCGPAAEGCE